MKLISFQSAAGVALGVVHPQAGDRYAEVARLGAGLPATLQDLLAGGETMLAQLRQAVANAAAEAAPWLPLRDARLRPPVPAPGKIVCVGLNYAEHAKEGGNARPEYPSFFLRGATSLIAHGDPLVLPTASDKLDYEAELAVVIGRRTRHATADNALAAVAGYACFNDGTLRDYQRKTPQWTIGKNFDGTGGFGPWLVTPDELPAGASGLGIVSRLNGQLMQNANTRDMLWSVAELIVLLTECLTLEPGDVIATGTPSGVGYARKPPVFMRDGDVIEIEIEGLGCLRNTVQAEEVAR
ncbi:MAG TPA: fumarylacetoacetate hydrolase family protein [Ramlibacter sp.]|nr:fumarylacetoacetate hydrolase family protein [Ramlibacter sp.]